MKSNKKKRIIIASSITTFLLIAVFVGLLVTGITIGWGPFSALYNLDGEVSAISKKYTINEHQDGVVFYGASNFRLWTEMENDLSEYNVQNHGFGGSTDKMLVKYADKILYPYNPEIVFFQTGSNDYVNLKGSDSERITACMNYKKEMFETFHEKLPNAKFVVTSGLLLPGRSQYAELTISINTALKDYCDSLGYMYFVDATAMTYDGTTFNESLFVPDRIHLNRDGQLKWCNEYIRPQLENLYAIV